jgi:hypothetical protein
MSIMPNQTKVSLPEPTSLRSLAAGAKTVVPFGLG